MFTEANGLYIKIENVTAEKPSQLNSVKKNLYNIQNDKKK